MDVSKAMNDARRFAWWKRRQMRNVKPGKGATRQFGWRIIGAGHFSQVFEHPDYPGLVLKLSCRGGSWGSSYSKKSAFRDEGAYTRHDAWQPFAKMCMLHPAPHLPVIYAYEQLTQSYAIAIMKRYEDAYDRQDTLRMAWAEWLNGAEKAPAWMWPAIQMREMMSLSVDLHGANVMMDGGMLIMTDPFSVAMGSGTAYGS